MSVNWCMDGHSDIFCEALRLCCHTCMHPSTEFGVMRTQICDDVCRVAWNRENLCSGRSGACKANNRSAVRHSSVTKWNVRCGGYGRSDAEFNSDDGRNREHGLGLVIGSGRSMWVDARRLMSRNKGAIWKMRKPFRSRMRVVSRRRGSHFED